MRRAAVIAPALAFVALACAAPAARRQRTAAAPVDPGQLCQRAIQAAEREHKVPAGLLHAIGKVEFGRPDASGRGVTAWPWTINAEGQGRYFDSKEAAIAAVEALRARGVTVIDVGCLQVNLKHHPDAFPDLPTAFDPVANARYAGLFLKRLQAQAGSWSRRRRTTIRRRRSAASPIASRSWPPGPPWPSAWPRSSGARR